jgi:hypothetical protein
MARPRLAQASAYRLAQALSLYTALHSHPIQAAGTTLCTPGRSTLARGLRTPHPLSCCLRHTSRARLPLQPLRAACLTQECPVTPPLWARSPAQLRLMARPGLLYVGPGPPPPLTTSHPILCLSVPSLFRALPPSLPLLLCSVTPVAPCFTTAPRLLLGPYASAWPRYHPYRCTPASLARSHALSPRLTQMCPHLHYWIYQIPQFSLRRAINDSCGRGIVLVLSDHVRTAIGGVSHLFVSAWCSPTGPQIRFPGEM